MEPGHEDREYAPHEPQAAADDGASMEPGHEDREYTEAWAAASICSGPQWSPVMKTGNTRKPGPPPPSAPSLNGARS